MRDSGEHVSITGAYHPAPRKMRRAVVPDDPRATLWLVSRYERREISKETISLMHEHGQKAPDDPTYVHGPIRGAAYYSRVAAQADYDAGIAEGRKAHTLHAPGETINDPTHHVGA
jgi:hypothetical protein